MKRKITLSTAITLLILSAALAVSVTMLLAIRYFNNQVKSVSQRQAMYTHINSVDKKVREYYPDLDEEKLQESITDGYIRGIGDPYATYYNAQQYATETLRMSGYAQNLGVTVITDAKGNKVVGTVETNSPADKAGLQAGDVFVAVDGEDVTHYTAEDIQNRLNATEKILISAQRGETALAVELTPFQYEVRSVKGTQKGNVGIVKVTAFYANTPDQFKATVSSLMENGATVLIFDLRDNNGGSSEAMQEIVNFIMPLGQYGTMTSADGTVTTLSADQNLQLGVPTTTLVNNATSGEAEFFAGVLQDFGLTTVVGEVTAGHTGYQAYFNLESDGSAIRLTVGEYSLLKSGSWKDKGITPDVEVTFTETQKATAPLLTPEQDPFVKVAVAQMGTTLGQ